MAHRRQRPQRIHPPHPTRPTQPRQTRPQSRPPPRRLRPRTTAQVQRLPRILGLTSRCRPSRRRHHEQTHKRQHPTAPGNGARQHTPQGADSPATEHSRDSSAMTTGHGRMLRHAPSRPGQPTYAAQASEPRRAHPEPLAHQARTLTPRPEGPGLVFGTGARPHSPTGRGTRPKTGQLLVRIQVRARGLLESGGPGANKAPSPRSCTHGLVEPRANTHPR